MTKKRTTEKRSVSVVTLLAVSLLLTESYGTGSKDRDAKNSSANKTARKTATADNSARKLAPATVRRRTADPSSFRRDMPFSEAIDILRHSTVPPLNIVVLWKDLQENADIYRDTPIGMDGLSAVPLKTHLKVLLMSVSGGSLEKLRYTVDEGVIIIATEGSLPPKVVTRIYDVSDLVSEPANYRFMPGFGMPFGFGGMSMGAMMPVGGAGSTGAGLGGGYGGSGFLGSGPFTSTSLGSYISQMR